MTMACAVCNHPDRSRLDRDLARGISMQALAAQSGVSADSLRRHRKNHLPVKVLQKQAIDEARDTLDIGRLLFAANGAAVRVLADARDANRPDLVLRAVDRVLACIALQVRIAEVADTTELQERLVRLEEKLAGAGLTTGLARMLGGPQWRRSGL